MGVFRKIVANVISLSSLVLGASAALADEFSESWGPAVGTAVSLEAPDQTGVLRSLDDLAGEQGLLLFLNRSADW